MRTLPLCALVALWAAFVALLLSPVLGDAGGDSAQYLALGEALARGDGYVDTHLPQQPLHVHYPPGLPLLHAGLVFVFGPAPYVPAKIAVLLLGAFGLLCFGRLFARLASPQQALLALGLGAFSPYVVRFGASLLTEIPAMAMIAATLLFLDTALREDDPRRARRAATLAVLFAASACSLRVASVVVLPPVTIALFLRLRWAALPRVVLAAAPLALFMAWGFGVGAGWFGEARGGGTWSYSDEIAARIGGPMDIAVHALGGLPIFVRGIGASIVDVPLVARVDALGYVLAAPVMVGLLWALFDRRRAPLAWTTLLAIAVACAAPERTMRYLVPTAPCFAFFFVDGCALVFKTLTQKLRVSAPLRAVPRFGLAIGAVLAMLQVPGLVHEVEARHKGTVLDAPLALRDKVAPIEQGAWTELRVLPEGSEVAVRFASFFQLMEAARQTTPADAVLLSRKPRFVSYLTGRRCLRLPADLAPEVLAQRLEAMSFDVFVDDGLFADTMTARPIIEQGLGFREATVIRSARLLQRPSPAVRPGR